MFAYLISIRHDLIDHLREIESHDRSITRFENMPEVF
jgi:hypothetical protein